MPGRRRGRLEPLSKCTLESSEADQAAGDRDECFVDVGATFVADTQPPMLMQPGECPLDDPALAAKAGAVPGALLGDQRFDSHAA